MKAQQILEWSIQHRDALTSVFFWTRAGRRARKIVYMPGAVGNTETVEMLRAFTDDRVLGRAAIDAIKTLTEHSYLSYARHTGGDSGSGQPS
jgi:hypothetical protein